MHSKLASILSSFINKEGFVLFFLTQPKNNFHKYNNLFDLNSACIHEGKRQGTFGRQILIGDISAQAFTKIVYLETKVLNTVTFNSMGENKNKNKLRWEEIHTNILCIGVHRSQSRKILLFWKCGF